MEDLRAELQSLVDKVPDDYLYSAVESLKFLSTTDDPFYRNANQKHLSESIKQFEEGKFQYHELIEVD